jgi:hypothetical protein
MNFQLNATPNTVIPAQAGIPLPTSSLVAERDSRLRGNDGFKLGAVA